MEELALVGLIVGKEAVQQRRDFHRLAQRKFARLGAVLIENRGLRVLENRYFAPDNRP